MNKIAKTSMSAALLVLLAAPASADSQGGLRCLVSFVIGDKKSLPDIPQFP